MSEDKCKACGHEADDEPQGSFDTELFEKKGWKTFGPMTDGLCKPCYLNSLKEFAFDVDINAVVRVKANSCEEAKELLKMVDAISGPDDLPSGVTMTEYSLDPGGQQTLFEVNGETVDEE